MPTPGNLTHTTTTALILHVIVGLIEVDFFPDFPGAGMNRTHCPDCAEDAVMRELFARPEAYIASAKAEATKHNITGFQFDFEAPGQAVNANKTMCPNTQAIRLCLRYSGLF